MDELGKLHDKLDAMNEKLNSMDKRIDEKFNTTNEILLRNTISLEIHEKRTSLLEKELKPIKDGMLKFKGILWFIGFLAVLATIAEFAHILLR